MRGGELMLGGVLFRSPRTGCGGEAAGVIFLRGGGDGGRGG